MSNLPNLRTPLRGYLINRYTAFFLFLIVFTTGLEMSGGLSSLASHWLIEGPVVLYLYFILNSVLKRSRWTPYIAALPIVTAYGLYDAYFMAFGEVFRFNHFYNLPELLHVLPLISAAALLAALGLPLLLIVLWFDYTKYLRAFAGSIPAVMLATNIQLFPGGFLTGFEKLGTDVIAWSDSYSVERNGRFAMLLYYEAARNVTLARSALYRDRKQYERQAHERADQLRRHINGRNVHLVILESFLDPTLFRGVTYSRDPRHPDYIALFGGKLGYSLSPVFGGGTAQAEFEALCGVPAYRALSSIEFNAFTGAPAHCLPDILGQAGYRTIVSNAFKPDFFNAINAYTGVGFGEIYFPAEYARQRSTYLSTGEIPADEDYMFDGTLFEQNVRFVADMLRQHPDKPILNYVLSIWGHFPHYMDPATRPQVLSVQSSRSDDQLPLVANQHYYRTEAIARYVRELVELDPHSLIILVSDHLPSLDGTDSYRNLRYLDNKRDSTLYNRIAVIEDGKVVHYRTIHHYDIPSMIYNYLTDGRFCTVNECNLFRTVHDRADYYDSYMRLMAHAVDTSS